MTENRVRVVAEYCPSCGGVHYPPAEKLGTGMLCTTCRYWQTHLIILGCGPDCDPATCEHMDNQYFPGEHWEHPADASEEGRS